jgi:hypothetical protein
MPTGLLRFLLPASAGVTESRAQRAYLAGPDQVPWPCRIRLDDGQLVVERQVSDSGKFHIPWPVEGHGEVVLSTATLMECDRPYHLPVELARGKVNQVRNQIAEWQSIGLLVPDKVDAVLKRALGHLALAVTTQHDPQVAAEHAERAIVAAVDAADLLVACYCEQALASRHRGTARLRTLLGAPLGAGLLDPPAAAAFLKAFNSAIVPMAWRQVEAAEGHRQWEISDRQIEWCEAQGLKVVSGPLVQLDRLALPDWLCLWEGDFRSIHSFVSDYVQAAVTRYRGRVHVWQCAARMNVPDALSLTEEQRLQLTVRAIEAARQADPTTPLSVSFDQPWAEYMSKSAPDLSPLHFADALVRAGLELGAVGLEINMGYQPGGSYLRDRLECSRLLDLWSYLGLPLHLLLLVPGGQAAAATGAASPSRPAPAEAGLSGGWTADSQAAWIKHYLPMMVAKPAVQAIFWNQFEDEASEFPHAGLFDRRAGPKPALAALAVLRKKHLE